MNSTKYSNEYNLNDIHFLTPNCPYYLNNKEQSNIYFINDNNDLNEDSFKTIIIDGNKTINNFNLIDNLIIKPSFILIINSNN